MQLNAALGQTMKFSLLLTCIEKWMKPVSVSYFSYLETSGTAYHRLTLTSVFSQCVF